MLRAHTILLFGFLLQFAQAQTQPASVGFTLDFPGSSPGYYAFRVQTDGTAQYESRSKLGTESDDEDSFHIDFTLSPAIRERIFALAARAGYFQKDLDSHRRGMAFTGKKTLAYQDAVRTGTAVYNYSSNVSVQELTATFQNISSTLEFGHRLQYEHRYQKLALDEELKRLEETVHSNMAIDLAAIAPILQQILDDPSVINVSRSRAQRILDQAKSEH